MAGNQDEKIKAISETEAERMLGKETFRQRINEIICEHINSVDFMKTVREYASMEMDSRMFSSFKYWLITILSSVATAAIAIFVQNYFVN